MDGISEEARNLKAKLLSIIAEIKATFENEITRNVWEKWATTQIMESLNDTLAKDLGRKYTLTIEDHSYMGSVEFGVPKKVECPFLNDMRSRGS